MKRKEDFIVRNIAGEYVMMPVGSTALKFNGLIMANEVSAFVWEKIEEVETPEELAEIICNEFEVDYDVALKDVLELIENLKIAGWIQ